MTYTSQFLNEFSRRGFLNQCTDLEALDAHITQGPLTLYVGFDATAKSLHVGNLVQIMALRRAQQAGLKPLVLMGGGTTKIGDPSGKNEMRKMLTPADIDDNIANIKRIFTNYVTFGDGPTDAIMVNNDAWLSPLNYLDFLRDYGRHFSINRMLTFDSVKSRLDNEQPLSFLEFNYMIFQAYDFCYLNEKYGCALQIGGGDQWGNIINGVELTRRVRQKTVYGLTTHLITTASGAKMGKTAAGAVWLDPAMISTFDLWQFWRNTEDKDVGRFLRLFTDLPTEHIAELERLEGAAINEAKVILANAATTLAHGPEAVAQVQETVAQLFVEKSDHDYTIGENGTLESALPIIDILASNLPLPAFDILHLSGLVASKGEAKRLIQGNGARLNGETITDENQSVTTSDFNGDGILKVSAGKKRHALLKRIP